ncbi:hypothetical protein [Streptomyces litchfieldiae]|uniref:Uncharacterized protein n=1 Tax=Streptomyces litchfieldiae TaxID=3075543 RepID=A0ABU2MP53_9ACTN|nr:hypothetical protein [Streptomyces sp. DSM 44938]MDT0343167.1 hypothetical protein [Streptomyces sp. DSM 44938]
MWRNALGSVLAAIAAAAAIASVFFDWYGSRDGRHFKWTELFTGDGITADNANLITGMFLPMLVVAALAVAAILLRSRLLMLLAGILTLGFTILWMVRQYQVADNLTIGQGGLKWPVAAALAAGTLLLITAAGMAGRHIAERRAEVAPAAPAAPGRREYEGAEPREEVGEVRRGPWPRDREAPPPPEGEAEPRPRHRHRRHRRDAA